MSHRISFTLLCILLILFATPVLIVSADSMAPAQTGPATVKVGIYLIRAGSLDISTGAIDVDFYLEFTCPGKCEEGMTDFEIVNGITKSKPLVEDADSDTKPVYRVSATVFQDVHLQKYPFDSHEIKILVEGNYDDTSLIYEVNDETTAIDPNVFILGWDIDKTSLKAKIVPQLYAPWESNYTRYQFTFQLTKPALAGWLKGLLPAIFIALGGIFALFITTKNIGNRVAIITSALVASVLYHLNFTSRVPPIGYLTFGDIFMIINYVILLIALSITIWMIRVDSAPEKKEAAVVEQKPGSRRKKEAVVSEPQPAVPSKTELITHANKLELATIPALWLLLHLLNALINL